MYTIALVLVVLALSLVAMALHPIVFIALVVLAFVANYYFGFVRQLTIKEGKAANFRYRGRFKYSAIELEGHHFSSDGFIYADSDSAHLPVPNALKNAFGHPKRPSPPPSRSMCSGMSNYRRQSPYYG